MHPMSQSAGPGTFVGGFAYLFRAAVFLNRHRRLAGYCIAPMLISLTVMMAAGSVLYFFFGDIVGAVWEKPTSAGWWMHALWYAINVFFMLTAVLLTMIVFFAAQALISAPFNDLLSERVEQLCAGIELPPFRMSRLLRGLWLTVLHESAKLLIWAAVMLFLFLLNFIPGIGTIMFALGSFYLTARFFVYDYLDYAMARREWRFREKWQFLRQHRALTLGFGASIYVLLLVPLVGALMLPLAVIGGTLLFCEHQSAASAL